MTNIRISKIACTLFCLVILSSNLWTMRNWTERTGVHDDICYLRQAHLFQRFGIGGFDTDISRDDDQYLTNLTEEIGIPAAKRAVCHTSMSATNKIVIQYPPGTGMLMAIFPSGFQRVPLYAAANFVIFAFSLAAIWSARARELVIGATIVGASALYFMINPSKASFSIAPTMMACATAGYLTAALLTGRGPRLLLAGATALLLGLSVSFRLPNLFLSAGLFLWLLIDCAKTREASSVIRMAVFTTAYVIGLSPTLVANAVNAGGPLSTTYSAGDAVPFDFSFSIVKDYLRDTQILPISAALIWATLSLRSAGNNLVPTVVLANLAFNLIFFFGHPIFTPYYLMPIAMLSLWTLLWGMLLGASARPAADPVASGLLLSS